MRFWSWRWRLAVGLLIGGGVIGCVQAVASVVQGSPALPPLLPGLASAVAGVWVLRRRERIADWWYLSVGLAGTVALSFATHAEGLLRTYAADNVLYYLWPILFIAAFLPRWATIVQTVASTVSYSVLLFVEVSAANAVIRSAGAAATFFTCAALIEVLRDYVGSLLDRVEEQSRRDHLTGLLNRRGLAEGTARLAAERSSAPLSLLLCDLDHFKRLNDAGGHEAGDAALARCARVLEEIIGSEGVVARQGGEEFVVVVRAPTARANVLAERVRDKIRSEVEGATGPLTVSIGIATAAPEDEVLSTLLRAADKALYVAKAAGRDRVIVEHELPADVRRKAVAAVWG